MGITFIHAMPNTSRKGNGAELKTAKLLQESGWLVASRRHIGGAADLLAIRPGDKPRLIEVKACKTLYSGNFRREDRAALIAEAERYGAVAECCWWPPRAREPKWLGVGDWPS